MISQIVNILRNGANNTRCHGVFLLQNIRTKTVHEYAIISLLYIVCTLILRVRLRKKKKTIHQGVYYIFIDRLCTVSLRVLVL